LSKVSAYEKEEFSISNCQELLQASVGQRSFAFYGSQC